MSSEDSAGYSDAQSGYSHSGDASPVPSSSSHDRREPRPKQITGASFFFRSETLFLALLFALIALLLPAFFFFASGPSSELGANDSEERRKSPLTTLVPYIPAMSTVFRVSFSASYHLLRPFIGVLSLILALLAPILLAANILFKGLVVLPSRMVIGIVGFFYPVYVFCGTACIFGAVVGLGGRLVVEGGRLMGAGTRVQQGKR